MLANIFILLPFSPCTMHTPFSLSFFLSFLSFLPPCPHLLVRSINKPHDSISISIITPITISISISPHFSCLFQQLLVRSINKPLGKLDSVPKVVTGQIKVITGDEERRIKNFNRTSNTFWSSAVSIQPIYI